MLKLQYIGHLIWRADSLEKTLNPDAGKDWRQENRVQRMRRLDGIIDSMDIEQAQCLSLSLSKLQEIVKDREAWHAAVHGVPKSQTWLSNWTTTTDYFAVQLKLTQYCKSIILQKTLLWQYPSLGIFLSFYRQASWKRSFSASTLCCVVFSGRLGHTDLHAGGHS